MAHTSSRFQSTTVVCSWKGRPARLQASMPARASAWAFGRPRNLSCLAASRLSTEMPMAAGAGLLQAAGHLVGDERAVAAEHRAQAAGGRMGHQLVDVGTEKRLAAGEDHDLEARPGDLVDHLLRLVGGKLALGGLLGVLVAVDALQVALVRGHPRYDHVGVSSPTHGRGRRSGGQACRRARRRVCRATRPQRGSKDTQSAFRGNRPNGLGWE